MAHTETKIEHGVDKAAIAERRIEIAARFVEKGADHVALSQELQELDKQEDKLITRYVPVIEPISTQLLWDVVAMSDWINIPAARDTLAEYLTVTIFTGGKGRKPIEEKAVVNRKGEK